MSWLSEFGSRNHPATKERRRTMQKAREGMAVSEETVAAYTAARGFLMAEWLGASLACASVVLLFLFVPHCPSAWPDCPPSALVGVPVWLAIAASLALFAGGGGLFLRCHAYYKRLDFPWAKRWDTMAIVVAGSAVIFWLLFALLEGLTAFGVHVLPG